MKSMKMRLLSIVLCVCMILVMMPISVAAEGEDSASPTTTHATPATGAPGGFNIFAFLLMKRFMTEYAVEIEVVGNGAVVTDDEDNMIRFSDDITLTLTPEEGAELISVTIDDEVIEVVDGTVMISNIKKAVKVVATFSELPVVEEVVEEVVEDAE